MWSEIGTGIVSSGVTAGIIVKLYGKYLIDSDLQKRSYKYESDLVKIKLEYESISTRISRFSESQFKVYENLWNSLMDLKISGEKLWNELDIENLSKFSDQLEETFEKIDKASILIEDQHYLELRGLMTKFANFSSGKMALFKMRFSEQNKQKITSEMMQDAQALVNELIKDSYEEILSEMRVSFRVTSTFSFYLLWFPHPQILMELSMAHYP